MVDLTAATKKCNLFECLSGIGLEPLTYKHTLSYSFIHLQALIVQDGPLASLFGVSCSHTYRHTVRLLWTSDQPVAETSTYTVHNTTYCYMYEVPLVQ
jgi:hypothetical protein